MVLIRRRMIILIVVVTVAVSIIMIELIINRMSGARSLLRGPQTP